MDGIRQLDSDEDGMDDGGEGYLSDSSSQDTVRERSMQNHPTKNAVAGKCQRLCVMEKCSRNMSSVSLEIL